MTTTSGTKTFQLSIGVHGAEEHAILAHRRHEARAPPYDTPAIVAVPATRRNGGVPAVRRREGARGRVRRRRAGWRQVNVSATTDWTDTGVQVRAGQTIYIEASGQVRWGRDRRDGPAGEKNSPFNQARPLPNRAGAALIGRVGGDVFFLADERGPIRVRNSGRLELGMNDDFLDDNSGSFRVTVFY